MKEKNKVKEEYNNEKKIEKEIDKRIGIIMRNSINTKDLLEFIEKVREYRTRIYELKMQLKEDIVKAYEEKEENEIHRFKEIEIRAVNYAHKSVEEMRYADERARTVIEQNNIINISYIFEYYEKEITFWQEMNVKKIMEIDEQEHFLE